VKILFIGDIVGKVGRELIKHLLPRLREHYQLDAVIANGENAAGGVGLTPKIAEQLFLAGVDILTSGNHIWKKKEIFDYIAGKNELIRPLNLSSPESPGAGSCVFACPNGHSLAVINLVGGVFMEAYSCPFRAAREEITRLATSGATILVDFHAEATAEKQALGWYLDGKVGAVLGTHTHVQTADERILPQGTAYISDVGMTGSMDSVLGVKKELAIQKFLTHMPVRFEPSDLNPRLHAVVVTIDPERRIAREIQRVSSPMPPQVH
jgi:hypothetical protein